MISLAKHKALHILLYALILGLAPCQGQARTSYLSYEEIVDQMEKWTTAHDQARLLPTASSRAGRKLMTMAIEDTMTVSKPKIPVHITATHHGNEKSSTEAALAIANYVLSNIDTPNIQNLLHNVTLYIQPLVNPDGYASGSRWDSLGQDLNRQYSVSQQPDEQNLGLSPEIKYVKNILSMIKPKGALALHSGMNAVLWPPGGSAKPSSDHNIFFTLAKQIALAHGTNRYLQSFFDYPTTGEYIDYVYSKYRTLALTYEVTAKATPEFHAIPAVMARVVQASLGYFHTLVQIREQTLVVEQPKVPVAKPAQNAVNAHATVPKDVSL